MSFAYLGKQQEAALAANALQAQDPKWTAEQYLSTIGGGTPAEAELFVEGARKLGVQACVSNQDLPGQSGLMRVKSCDEERARSASG